MRLMNSLLVALAGGRREVVQPFDLLGAQLDAVGGCVAFRKITVGSLQPFPILLEGYVIRRVICQG
jgi:hypothetical protein